MSHIVRCQVLQARHEDRAEWLADTVDYLAGRYPRLGELELAQLESIGKQYLKPVIQHGPNHTAITRDRELAAALEADDDAGAEAQAEAPVEAQAETPVEAQADAPADAQEAEARAA